MSEVKNAVKKLSKKLLEVVEGSFILAFEMNKETAIVVYKDESVFFIDGKRGKKVPQEDFLSNCMEALEITEKSRIEESFEKSQDVLFSNKIYQ